MEVRDLALTALRVLSAWMHGERPTPEDAKVLLGNALAGEDDLSLDELACRIVARTCAKVIQESQADRKAIEFGAARTRKEVA